jgi:RHS repeat-associated protein
LPVSISLSYDENGNLVSDVQKGFEYDDENQLIRVTSTNAWKIEFSYDAKLRRRITMEYAWQAGNWVATNEIRYIYDGNLVVQERKYNPQVSSSVPQQYFLYTRGRDLSGTREVAGGIGGLLAISQTLGSQSANYYYFADRLGNVTTLTATNQLIVARFLYDPYGNTLSATGPAAALNRYRFSSKEWDERTGLYYYLYRYYAPFMQRWANRDPIGTKGGYNIYVFNNNNSIKYIDTYGLERFPDRAVVACDGNGNWAAFYPPGDPPVERICTVEHENIHLDDLKKQYPNACVGFKRGDNPINNKDYVDFWIKTETEAYKANLECFKRLSCKLGISKEDKIIIDKLIEGTEIGLKIWTDKERRNTLLNNWPQIKPPEHYIIIK